MTPEVAEFVDRIGLFFEALGGTRTMGRVYGWLMICDPPHQSLTELAAVLGVSKASASTIARQLLEAGMIERLPAAGRQHRYRVTPGGFTRVLEVQLTRMRPGVPAAEYGLSLLGEDHPEQRAHLEDFRAFCEFSTTVVRDEFMRRWEDYRAERKKGSS